MAVVLCGGNIDITTLGRVIERALLATGRLCRFTITITDRPGGLAQFLNICADAGVRFETQKIICEFFKKLFFFKFSLDVKDMQHDRVLLTSFVYRVNILNFNFQHIKWLKNATFDIYNFFN